jgi:paraquat-inducible protein A
MACPECDLIHEIGPLPRDETANCRRCGALLRHGPHGSLDTPLALSIAGLVLFGLANASPLFVLQLHGSLQAATIPGCVQTLVSLGWPWLAAILITTIVLAPPVHLAGLVFVLVQAKRRRRHPWTARLFRIVLEFQGWGMAEVFVLGLLVAYVRLARMAVVIPGQAMYALAAFTLTTAVVVTTLDADTVWDALGGQP